MVYFALQLPGTIDDIDALHRATEQESIDFTIGEATTWQIFLEPNSESLAGTQVAVVDAATGEPLALGRPSTFSYAWGTRSGRSVGSVALDPGNYRLVVQGDARFAIGPNPGPRFIRSVIWALVIGVPLLIGGAAFAIVSAVRDTRRRTREAEQPPPSPWSAGEWPAESNR